MDPASNRPSAMDALYESRVRHFAHLEVAARKAFERMGNRRLVLLVLTVASFVAGTFLRGAEWINLSLYLAGLAGVIVSVAWALRHQRLDEELARTGRMLEANVRARQRLKRAWGALPVPVAGEAFENLPESRDLDLFGKGSLFQLLCATHSPQGRHTLAMWLTDPAAAPATVEARQSAVRELAPHLEWRQRLGVIGEELGPIRENDPAWLSGEAWLSRQPRALLAARLLPLPIVGFLLAALAGQISFLWPLGAIVVGLGFSRRHRARLAGSIHAILGQERAVHHYAELFAHLHTLETRGGHLATLHTETDEAHEAFAALATIGGNAGAHGSLVHPLLQGLLLWDFHVVRRIEAWQDRYRGRLGGWFRALGEIEALASLAGLAHDEPDWVYPESAPDKRLSARALGHPLIAAERRVRNDVSLGPEGTFLLVTGSNMSGKSTLLRTLGLNVILAQAGAPVCAASLSLPSLRLATSMRVQDSLGEGVSFFMAELRRMREIVSAAVDGGHGRTLLYLLDEILQGTNTVERQVIVARIVRRLLGCDAIGAITTHDLALAEGEDLKMHARRVHFREEFHRDEAGHPQMTFDYQLRPGLATTTNALKILEVIDMPV